MHRKEEEGTLFRLLRQQKQENPAISITGVSSTMGEGLDNLADVSESRQMASINSHIKSIHKRLMNYYHNILNTFFQEVNLLNKHIRIIASNAKTKCASHLTKIREIESQIKLLQSNTSANTPETSSYPPPQQLEVLKAKKRQREEDLYKLEMAALMSHDKVQEEINKMDFHLIFQPFRSKIYKSLDLFHKKLEPEKPVSQVFHHDYFVCDKFVVVPPSKAQKIGQATRLEYPSSVYPIEKMGEGHSGIGFEEGTEVKELLDEYSFVRKGKSEVWNYLM